MTSQEPAATRWSARRTTMAGIGSGVALLLQLVWPAPAEAWWGKLEKLSGPGPFTGLVYEFRVACFGSEDNSFTAANVRTSSARVAIATARRERSTGKSNWVFARDSWNEAAQAWAAVIDETYVPPSPTGAAATEDDANRAEADARDFRNRAYSMGMAKSAVGVFWSFCSPEKDRRVGLDVSLSTLDASGRDYYAGGAPINLDTLMASVSWRMLADTKVDFVDVSTGGGVYWFTSTGFPSKSGVVLQPVRLTFRAPPSWSSKRASHIKRWAALPSYAFGITTFPGGFEADDFNATGDRAVRLPRELIATHYVFVNVQPLLQMLRK